MAWELWRAINVPMVAGLSFPFRCRRKDLRCMNLAKKSGRGMVGPPGEVWKDPVPRGAMG